MKKTKRTTVKLTPQGISAGNGNYSASYSGGTYGVGANGTNVAYKPGAEGIPEYASVSSGDKGAYLDSKNGKGGVYAGDKSVSYSKAKGRTTFANGDKSIGISPKGSVAIQSGDKGRVYNPYTGEFGMINGDKEWGVGPGGQASYSNSNISASYDPANGGLTGGINNPIGAKGRTGNVSYGATVGAGGGAGVIQIGQGEGNKTGASGGAAVGSMVGSIYGPLGSIVGGAVGSAVGSVAGGAFNPSHKTVERQQREGFLNALAKHGFTNADGTLELPDGTVAQLNKTGMSTAQARGMRNPGMAVDGKDRQLRAYDTDYTNDMDYVSNMAGNSLTRLVGGGSGKAVDQAGAFLGNQLLGKVGTGADMTQGNFNNTMQNARSAYAKAGINSKDDMIALANKQFADGRINDFDHAAYLQTAGLVFDNDYGSAQALMAGRNGGVKSAASTAQAPVTQEQDTSGRLASSRSKNNGMVIHPYISREEAIQSALGWNDFRNSMIEGNQREQPSSLQQLTSTIRQGTQTAVAIKNAYGAVKNLMSGSDHTGLSGSMLGNDNLNLDSSLNTTASGSPFEVSEPAVPTDGSYIGSYNLDNTLELPTDTGSSGLGSTSDWGNVVT